MAKSGGYTQNPCSGILSAMAILRQRAADADRGTALAGGFGAAVGARLRAGETNGLVSQTVVYLHHALHLHGDAITHVRIVTPLLDGFQR
jgi:hypothetical protein